MPHMEDRSGLTGFTGYRPLLFDFVKYVSIARKEKSMLFYKVHIGFPITMQVIL